MRAYLIDEDDLRRMNQLQKALHAGNDRERDHGHVLWLLCQRISANEVEIDEMEGEK